MSIYSNISEQNLNIPRKPAEPQNNRKINELLKLKKHFKTNTEYKIVRKSFTYDKKNIV